MARSRARVDVSDIKGFENRLNRASQLAAVMRDDWENDWGSKWAEEMKVRVPVDTGELREAITHISGGGTAPGGITFGRAFYWRFLEYGTSKMTPRPFIRPSMRKIRTPARKDAGERALDLIHKGF